mmetsp:Transcript_902/g.3153  ORF Transcript_902/g.3153 Transcript_902/m.3153 type:complete len:535 (+) Transcript_902:363-1967(+)
MLHVPQRAERGQRFHRVHGLQLHLVFQAQKAALHVLPARHLAVELPRDRPEGLLGRLHTAKVVTVFQLDVSVHRGHLQGPVVCLTKLVGVLVVANLRARPEVRQATGATQVEGLLCKRLLVLRLRRGLRLDVVAGHTALLGLTRSDTLPLRDLLLVQGRSPEALVLHGVQLLERRLHDVAELRRCGHRDVGRLAGLETQSGPVLLILLLGVAQALDALGDGRQRSLALLHGAGVGPADQAPLLGQLLVELRILLIGAGILRPASGGGRVGVADLVLFVLGVRGLAALRLLLGRLPELQCHLLGCVIVRLELGLCLERVLLAQGREDGELLLGVRLVHNTHRRTRDHESRRPRLELIVLGEDVLALLGRIIVNLLLLLLVVLCPLGVCHADVGELVGRLVVNVALLVQDGPVAERHCDGLAILDVCGIVPDLHPRDGLGLRELLPLLATLLRCGPHGARCLHAAVLVAGPCNPVRGTALALLVLDDLCQALPLGQRLVFLPRLGCSRPLLGVLRGLGSSLVCRGVDRRVRGARLG